MELIVLRSTRDDLIENDRVPVSASGLEPEQFSVSLEDVSEKEAQSLRRDPKVIDTAPSMPTALIRAFASPRASSDVPKISWGVEAVRATTSDVSGGGIKVAILDTGIADHPAFDGVKLIRKNFTKESDEDTDGHGTHCAGTFFGRDVDGCRIGIATGVKTAFVAKVIGKRSGTTSDIVKAIHWAWGEGAQVISMSLGIDFAGYQKELVEKKSLPAEVATSEALAGYRANLRIFDRLSHLIVDSREGMRSAVLVAASGNESKREISTDYVITLSPPAAGDSIVSVGALGQGQNGAYTIAPFSNAGVRISAPGVNIWSADLDGRLVSLDGTSMATPHVAGVAALWAQKLVRQGRPFDARLVIQRIEAQAMDLPYLSFADVGVGLVQAPQP